MVESKRSDAMKNLKKTKLFGGALILAGALLSNSAPAMAQDYGYAAGYNSPPAAQVDNVVSRIALYPDPLLAQIFAAAAFPDQVAAAAQGSGGPFDPSVEALMQYPSVLQMMASDPGWTQALGQAVMQDEAGVMDAIQNLRREAQQYGYLQSGPQMQVVDQGGYIDIMPVGGYMYVPVYDPYIVFARPRPGFFVGGAIRFGGGFRFSGYNRFDWRSHELFVNRRVWTPPVRRMYEQPGRFFGQRRYENSRPNFTAPRSEQRNFAPSRQMEQRNFTPQQSRPDFGRQNQQRNFAPAQQQPQQRNFAPQRQMEQPRNFAPQRQMEQPRNFTPQRQMEQPRNFTPQRQMQQQRNSTPQQQPQRFNQGGFRHGGEDRGHRR
jgi:hypothetical protein